MYLTRTELADEYSLSIATVDRLIKDMRSKPRYKSGVLRISHKCTRIKDSAFKDFLLERSKK